MSGPSLENMDIMEGDDSLSEEIMNMSTADIQARTRLLDNEVSSRILIYCLRNLEITYLFLDPYYEV